MVTAYGRQAQAQMLSAQRAGRYPVVRHYLRDGEKAQKLIESKISQFAGSQTNPCISKGLLICVLCAISACSSSSNTTASNDTGTNPPEVDSLQRISSLSESIDSFEGVQRIGWFEIDESDQIPLVSSTAVFFEIDSANPQSNRATIFLDTLGDTCAVEY